MVDLVMQRQLLLLERCWLFDSITQVEGLEQGLGKGIHVDLNKEVEKKCFRNHTKIWAIVNSLRNNEVKLILNDDDDSTSQPS
ncbi:hypothetical protein SO802_016364 [Lithocarpus litseifolius]|uniref:Uncharacterized protein n=1 Tax=Lithocarpus litseifolius TaxID=425828 RepID=A0AAW2CWC3_9ROSI